MRSEPIDPELIRAIVRSSYICRLPTFRPLVEAALRYAALIDHHVICGSCQRLLAPIPPPNRNCNRCS